MRITPWGRKRTTVQLTALGLAFFIWMVPQSSTTYAQSTSTLKKEKEHLTLDKAISRVLAVNRDMLGARMDLRTAEMAYDTAWETMFLPTANLQLGLSTGFTLFNIPGETPPLSATQGDGKEHGYPAVGTFGIAVGRYTLFNFWKDWLAFQKARMDWDNAKRTYVETVRKIRFDTISAFFTYKAEQEKVTAAQESIDFAETIVELVKSQFKAGKANETELSSSIVDHLTAKSEIESKRTAAKSAIWALNTILTDPLDTEYKIDEEIRYAPVKVPLDQALKMFMDQSPTMRNARMSLKKAEIDLDLAEKNRLPLPTVQISGINFGYVNKYYYGEGATGFKGEPFTTSDSANNRSLSFGFQAGVAISIPLWGNGGFLGGRLIEGNRISRDKAELAYQTSALSGQSQILTAFATLKQYEEQIKNTRQTVDSANKLLSGIIEQISKGTLNRLELRDALKQAREARYGLTDALVQHMKQKLSLAATIGVDQLPGDVY